jgi:hypothetical protein
MFDIPRHLNDYYWISRHEILMMIEQAIRSSVSSGREVKLQTICAALLCFYLTWRPGTFAGSFDEYIIRKLVRSHFPSALIRSFARTVHDAWGLSVPSPRLWLLLDPGPGKALQGLRARSAPPVPSS